MKIVGHFSFANGKETVQRKYPDLLLEIQSVVEQIDASKCKTKISKEKTMRGRKLFSPKALNKAFKKQFSSKGWDSCKISCAYSANFYLPDYQNALPTKGAFREMDFIKRRLGVEVQFGKYAFMVYNVCAKMTIFKNHDYIDAGIEIVPVKRLAEQMSTGVSYYEQFVWDLQNRGQSNIDIPVFILGIDE
ncbi:MAG: BglII/BstYI family type II restriction endonuclease [Verrucomicrobiota bacterium]